MGLETFALYVLLPLILAICLLMSLADKNMAMVYVLAMLGVGTYGYQLQSRLDNADLRNMIIGAMLTVLAILAFKLVFQLRRNFVVWRNQPGYGPLVDG